MVDRTPSDWTHHEQQMLAKVGETGHIILPSISQKTDRVTRGFIPDRADALQQHPSWQQPCPPWHRGPEWPLIHSLSGLLCILDHLAAIFVRTF